MKTLSFPSPVTCVTFVPNGQNLVIGNSSGEIEIRDLRSANTHQKSIQAHTQPVTRLAFQPISKHRDGKKRKKNLRAKTLDSKESTKEESILNVTPKVDIRKDITAESLRKVKASRQSLDGILTPEDDNTRYHNKSRGLAGISPLVCQFESIDETMEIYQQSKQAKAQQQQQHTDINRNFNNVTPQAFTIPPDHIDTLFTPPLDNSTPTNSKTVNGDFTRELETVNIKREPEINFTNIQKEIRTNEKNSTLVGLSKGLGDVQNQLAPVFSNLNVAQNADGIVEGDLQQEDGDTQDLLEELQLQQDELSRQMWELKAEFVKMRIAQEVRK